MGDLKIIIAANIRKSSTLPVLFKKYLVFMKRKMIKILNLRGNFKTSVRDHGGGGISWWEHTVDVSYHDALEEGNNENNSAGRVVVE